MIRCFKCNAILAEGDFDAEFYRPDFAVCNTCDDRIVVLWHYSARLNKIVTGTTAYSNVQELRATFPGNKFRLVEDLREKYANRSKV